MKSTAKHRAKHRTSNVAPRNGAAALMIGGLVAGTVATAGAATLTQKPNEGAGLAASLNDTLRPSTAESAPSETPPAHAASLRSASLDELRAQPAADRSQARSAPEDAASVSTLLEDVEFTGTTIEVEVEAPVEEAPAETTEQVEEVVEPVEQEPAQQAEPAREEPVQQAAAQEAPAQQASPAPVGGSVLDVAASYVGYPYQLMGTPPSAFDCSAYTWWVFQQAGISIPRSVAGQRGAVTPVSDPQPGDLIFYNDWHHVGIYAGNGMTYEALNPGTGVRYGPLLSSNVWYGRIG
jgi:peptidoglycan DL-endopeptidase CwlO